MKTNSTCSKFAPVMALPVFVAAFLFGTVHGWAAGSDDHTHGKDMMKLVGQSGQTTDINRTIEISLEDNYYEPEEIAVMPGETIRFILKNNGEFVHEFNIGTPDMHAAHQDEMALMMEHGMLEPDKINHTMMGMDMGDQMMKHDDPNSKLLEPGESSEIIWKFAENGTIEFACNVPGHYDSGMTGMFRFTDKITPVE